MKATDNFAHKFPVSIKGIVAYDEEILLLKNERDEWELPGGKLELYEDPISCLEREIHEETNLKINVIGILDTWQYHIYENVDVLIITYYCTNPATKNFTISHEHKTGQWFRYDEIDELNMPKGYKCSIKKHVEVYFPGK